MRQNVTTTLLERHASYGAATLAGRGPQLRRVPLGSTLRDAIRGDLQHDDVTVSEFCRRFAGTWSAAEIRRTIEGMELAGELDLIRTATAADGRSEFVCCEPLAGGPAR